MDAPECRKCDVGLERGSNWYESDADAYQYICISCRNARSKAWRRANPARVLVNRARRRAERKDIPFEITPKDVRVPNYCPVLGVRLQLQPEDDADSPSLDRIDPDKGYVPGNVQVISKRANTLKNNASAHELRALASHQEDIERRAE